MKTSNHSAAAAFGQPLIPLNNLVFWVFWLVSSVFVLILSKDFALSGDEYIHREQAQLVWDYFLEGDEAALHQPETFLHFYGQSFDFFMAGLERLFNPSDPYRMRHFFNALFGMLTVLFGGLIGRRMSGTLVGVVTMLVLLTTPRFFGHMMNNPLDIPFALGYTAGIYFILRLSAPSNKSRPWLTLLGYALSVALAISVRVGGILLIPIALMMWGLRAHPGGSLQLSGWFKQLWLARSSLLWLLIFSLTGYLLGLLPWPYALQDVWSNPWNALERLSSVAVGINTLWDGEIMESRELPWYYLPKMMWMTIPLVFTIGLAAFVMRSWKYFNLNAWLIVFAFAFPLFYVIVKGANLYGGWRHFLFIYPAGVVLAVLGWKYLFIIRKEGSIRTLLGVFFVSLVFLPTYWMIREHPYQYTYFNQWSGGIVKNASKYETDYYCNGLKGASDWLKSQAFFQENLKQGNVLISTNNFRPTQHYFSATTNARVTYARYENTSEKKWDYGIFYIGYVHPHQIEQGYWPPAGTIHTEEVEGVPIACVVKRPSTEDYYGFQALKNRQFNQSISHFKAYLAVDPTNEQGWFGLGNAYFYNKQYQQALDCAERSFELHPDNPMGLWLAGRAIFELENYTEAHNYLNKVLKESPNYAPAYYYIGLTYYNQQQYNLALEQLLRSAQLDPKNVDTYHKLGITYEALGNTEMSQKMMDAYKQLTNP